MQRRFGRCCARGVTAHHWWCGLPGPELSADFRLSRLSSLKSLVFALLRVLVKGSSVYQGCGRLRSRAINQAGSKIYRIAAVLRRPENRPVRCSREYLCRDFRHFSSCHRPPAPSGWGALPSFLPSSPTGHLGGLAAATRTFARRTAARLRQRPAEVGKRYCFATSRSSMVKMHMPIRPVRAEVLNPPNPAFTSEVAEVQKANYCLGRLWPGALPFNRSKGVENATRSSR